MFTTIWKIPGFIIDLFVVITASNKKGEKEYREMRDGANKLSEDQILLLLFFIFLSPHLFLYATAVSF